MRILALRHVCFEGLGRLAPELDARGITFDYADLYAPGVRPPDLSGYQALIILGGPMSANDPDAWIATERAIIRDAIARDLPILAICLGAQLVAKALGAEVFRNPEREIGWFDIDCPPAASADPLFCHFAARESVFHWHSETFSLPAGSILLASSSRCAHQAFRYGKKIYAMQFHLEVTPQMISDWVVQDENAGDVRELDAPIDAYRNCARLDEIARNVFGAWCALVKMQAFG